MMGPPPSMGPEIEMTSSVLLALMLPWMASVAEPPSVGQPFPLLEFPLLGEDRLTTLEEFEGTKVLLIQFASW